MFKEVLYNQNFTKKQRTSEYSQEFKLIQDFCGGKDKNMRFEYINNREARNATQAIQRFAKLSRTPIETSQRGNYVFVTRKEGEEQ